jgi:hypothetical protein
MTLVCVLAAANIMAQAGGTGCEQETGAVERKDDRFTGEAIVKLKPQTIDVATPGRQLKMALEYKVRPKKRGPAESFIPEMIDVVFTSSSASRVFGREAALVFLIDGERTRRVPGAIHDDFSRPSTEKTLTQTVFTGMTSETLRRISQAKTVEMKLGDTEVKLKPEVLDLIRTFARCALGNN